MLITQEVHGDSEAIAHYMHGLSRKHTYRYSPGPDSGTGGILKIIHKCMLHEAILEPTLSIFQPGRLVNLEARFSFGQFSIWGFHDFDISAEHSECARNSFKVQFENSSEDPLRNVLVAIGDFNRARDNAR